MAWVVTYHDAFDPEFDVLPETVQDALLGAALLLQAPARCWAGRMLIR